MLGLAEGVEYGDTGGAIHDGRPVAALTAVEPDERQVKLQPLDVEAMTAFTLDDTARGC